MRSPTLVKDRIFQVVTHIRTDIALEPFSVGMVKEGRKDRLTFDSQCLVFKGTIMTYNRLLPSVETIVVAQPSPEVAKNSITGCVCSASVGVTLGNCILRGLWRSRWLRGYRRNESPSRKADRSQAR